MESKKIAIIAGSVFMVILLLGITIQREGRRPEYPQYRTRPSFFSEEPLPTNPVPALVSAKVTITWRRRHQFVIVDSDRKTDVRRPFSVL